MTTVFEPDTRLRVHVVTQAEELAAMAGDWNRLAGENPFRRWEWLEAAWRHYHQGAERLVIACVTSADGELLGLLPLTLAASPLSGRVLRLLGSIELCSEYLGVLVRDEHREEVVRELARWLTSEGAPSWDLLQLKDVDPTDPAVAALVRRLKSAAFVVHDRETVRCWSAPLPGSWDSYLKLLSRSRRERVRKLVRRNFDAGRAVRRVVRTPEELEKGFEILCRLHQLRWTSMGETGIFATRAAREFHREVTERFLAAGLLNLAWIELDGEPVSAEYCLAGGSTMYYYQGGIDTSRADEDPGWLQFIASIHAAIGDGFTTYDFLRGDEPYKASWRATAVPLHEIRIVGRSRMAAVRHAGWKAKTAAKRWIKQQLKLAT